MERVFQAGANAASCRSWKGFDMRDKPESVPMVVDLEGRTAVVTGGGTGIGRAVSIGLARCGASVVVNFSRSTREAEKTVEEVRRAGGQAIAVRADVTDEQQVADLMTAAVERFGGLDILVANAGAPGQGRLTSELTGEQWEHDLATNCRSAFFCVKHAMAHLPDGRGRIILTGSMSARTGATPGALTYVASKAALEGMTRNWAQEFGPRGITVNTIAPGIVRTRLHARASAERYQYLIGRIPLGRDGQPEDCVGAFLLLAGDDGAFITGQVIEVGGGMLAS